MDRNAYRNELDRIQYTEAGRAALAERLTAAQAAVRPVRRLWVRRGLAAAAAAVLLVGSAVAAAGPLWERYFGQLDEGQQEIIETLSQELPAAESNGTVMTPLAAFGGQDFYYLMLEIRAPEGTALPDYNEDEGYYQLFNPDTGEDMTLTDSAGGNIRGHWEFEWMDRNGDSGALTAVIRFWPVEGVDFSDGTDKILHIPGLWVQDPDKNYTPVLTGGWDFNIGGHAGDCQVRELDAAGVETSDAIDDGDSQVTVTMTMESLRLSSLGMRWRYSWPEPIEGIVPGAGIAVVMDDGSEVTVANTMGSYQEEECWHEVYGPFEAPIDMAHAAAVRWGDALIPIR